MAVTPPSKGLELDFIFHPRSIAVAGASADPDKRGNRYIHDLIELGFRGPLYPVNPRGEDVLGLKGYTSLLEIPGPVDSVISSIPASAVLDLIDECAKKEVRFLHLFTARFSETGHADAAELERELLRRAKGAGIRLLGPNCIGIHYPAQGLAFSDSCREPGPVGILSQSGGNSHSLLYAASLRGVSFSKAVSYGNALDINEADLMEYFGADPETAIIGGYMEGIKSGPRFARVLREAAARKPVVLWKGGSSEAGTRAVASHTASLAGSRQVWEALMEQAGAVSVETLDELVDTLVAFQLCKPVMGQRVGVIGGGGGRGVESADSCESAGLRVAPIPKSLQVRFKDRAPLFWDWIGNPVDGSILGGSGINEHAILEFMAADSTYDLFIANTPDLWDPDSPDALARHKRAIKGYLEVADKIDKPLALVINDTVGEGLAQTETLAESRRAAVRAGMPVFPSIRRAALAMGRLATYYRNRQAR